MKRITPCALLLVCFLTTINLYAQSNRPTTTNVQDMDIFYHTVESGQTVYAIAKIYDVMVLDIHRLNPGSEDVIKTGQRLLIPQRRFEEKSILSAKSNDNYTIHTIKEGENIFRLSKQYSVTEDQILQANPGLSRATLIAGKNIRIPKAVKQQPVSKIIDLGATKEVYYTVPSGETYYNINRVFKATESELLNLNPELAGGLREGMTIRIPLRVNESELPNVVKPKTTTALSAANKLKLANSAKIALLLPVDLHNTQPTENRILMAEFYEGFLIAAETMLKRGFVAEIFTYELGEKNVAKTRQLLREKGEELKKVNLIIGGETPEQIKLIADFAQEHKIKYVIPFSRNNTEVYHNPFIFQANTPRDYLSVTAANAGANLFGKHNIIFLDTKDTLNHTEFVRQFKQELQDRNISYKDLVYDAEKFEDDILSLLSTTKSNMILPISQSRAALHKIKPVLRKLVEMTPEYNLSLYGYPLWQTLDYIKDFQEDFHVLDTYIYGYFYADVSHPNMNQFYDDYKKWFTKSPEMIDYKYSMLGYDTGMFFFNAMHQFGINFEERLSEINYKSLQTGFKFEHSGDGGGFINTNLYIIHFNKEFTIIRSDFK